MATGLEFGICAVAREDFGATVFFHQVDFEWGDCAISFHAGRTNRHSRHTEANGVGLFGQKSRDVFGRDVAFNHVAADLSRVATGKFLRNASG